MQAIEGLLLEVGLPFAYAADRAGSRVHPGNAYTSKSLLAPESDPSCTVGPATGVVYVECEVTSPATAALPVIRVDHHRPGDAGYGQGAENFLPASSLGQVIALLAQDHPEILGCCVGAGASRLGLYRDADWGWVYAISTFRDEDESTGDVGDFGWAMAIPQPLLLCAAADHCLEAAYRGRCPGVAPDDLMVWRAESRAAFQGRPVAAVIADVDAAVLALHHAVQFHRCADLRGLFVPELPEAAARTGIPFLATAEEPTRTKTVLQAASPELVAQFLLGDIVAGLIDTYGDPARGFAGGYTPKKERHAQESI